MCSSSTWKDVNIQCLQEWMDPTGLLFLTPFPTPVFFLRGALKPRGQSTAASARSRDTGLVPTRRRGKPRGKSGC